MFCLLLPVGHNGKVHTITDDSKSSEKISEWSSIYQATFDECFPQNTAFYNDSLEHILQSLDKPIFDGVSMGFFLPHHAFL